MNSAYIRFGVVREGSSVTGFSLEGVGSFAKSFCLSFPEAMREKRAKIEVKDTTIAFVCHGVPSSEEPEIFETEIAPEEARVLRDILTLSGSCLNAKLWLRMYDPPTKRLVGGFSFWAVP
jgi:vacuolar-type H+-ATPase subunit F/Vma7